MNKRQRKKARKKAIHRFDKNEQFEVMKQMMGQLAYDLYQEQEVIGGWDKDGPILVTRKQQKEAQKAVMEHVKKLIDEVAEAKKHEVE